MEAKKINIAGASLLGFASAISSYAQGDITEVNSQNLENLNESNVTVNSVDSLVGFTCYGHSCGPVEPVNNCDDSVIASNLQKLRDLNIVNVTSLSPFSCTGYCFTDTPQGREHDKCAKAEALAKLVNLAKPLAVSKGP